MKKKHWAAMNEYGQFYKLDKYQLRDDFFLSTTDNIEEATKLDSSCEFPIFKIGERCSYSGVKYDPYIFVELKVKYTIKNIRKVEDYYE